jgi:hypothetical protein
VTSFDIVALASRISNRYGILPPQPHLFLRRARVASDPNSDVLPSFDTNRLTAGILNNHGPPFPNRTESGVGVQAVRSESLSWRVLRLGNPYALKASC